MSAPPHRPVCGLRAVTTPWARSVHARYRVAGRVLSWTGPPGRGPAGLLAAHTWQAAHAWQAATPGGL
jgi:hypothetical protein